MRVERSIIKGFSSIFESKRGLFLSLLLLIFSQSAFAQKDSTVLSFENYMDIVKKNHPLAKQADLQVKKGKATELKARGSFDPAVMADADQKYFNKKEYYTLLSGGLKVPTWFGIELKGGYEQNQTLYPHPENTPEGGLWYAGISVPLGQGLFIDKRRAELRKAQLYRKSTVAERQAILNELLYDAGKAYWEWFRAYHALKIYENTVSLAQQRFQAVQESVKLGDKPSIDQVEAGIQLQNRKISFEQALLEYENAKALLAVYLWADGWIPMEISNETMPLSREKLMNSMVDKKWYAQKDSLLNNHPELQQYQYKIDQLKIEKRLKKELLKPKLNLNYNALTESVNNEGLAAYSINNYKWGLNFKMPLFLRKERGDLKLANLKLQEVQQAFTMKNAILSYKATASLNEWETTRKQVEMFRQTVKDYQKMLNGEWQMFQAGESSLFMVNSREKSYINAETKLVELLAKNQKADLTSRFALGSLYDDFR